ncbi:hypothetical protein WOLCODRAFT_20593 [Wolfiporia cocos MD-104 SS10]|uniref:Uncharacterized protein n=1 Tax=Wolfiporia cocos (strain MD-104) TaxID=742152 RepID=A0A2H3JIK9_WOLCO|nr:hypothetical protein WOLCODRAFT_20593 [Wolfiporia cocos MD-104 SS10]
MSESPKASISQPMFGATYEKPLYAGTSHIQLAKIFPALCGMSASGFGPLFTLPKVQISHRPLVLLHALRAELLSAGIAPVRGWLSTCKEDYAVLQLTCKANQRSVLGNSRGVRQQFWLFDIVG